MTNRTAVRAEVSITLALSNFIGSDGITSDLKGNVTVTASGRLSLSGLVRVDSGLTYSLVASSVPLSEIQTNLLNAAGYPDAPSSQNVYFGVGPAVRVTGRKSFTL